MNSGAPAINLASVGYVVACWLACTLTGYGVAAVALPASWQRDRAVLAPILGAITLILLAANVSYLGASMRMAAPLVLAAGLAVSFAGILAARRAGRAFTIDWRSAGWVHLLGAIAGGGALVSVVLYRAWNPYSDAFTYISIADYLQHHSYFDPAIPTATQPLLTQMALYQRFGFRMGSNFLLAFFTALFRAEYSFDLYLPVLALGLWVGVPSFWILCRRALFMPVRAARLSTVLYALHNAIPVANALSGFMPQTWGLALLMVAIAFHLQATQRGDRVRRLVLAGAMVAMVILSYPEIVPFMLAGTGMCYLGRLVLGRLRFREAVVGGVLPLAIAAAVIPLAAWAFVRVITTQYAAIGGWDVGLSFFDYVAMLAGVRSILQGVIFTPGLAHVAWRVLAVVAAITAAWALAAVARRVRSQVVALGLVFVVGLVWSTLCTVNPWNPAQLGHPWITYKLVTYGFFLFAALWGSGLSALWDRGLLFRLGAGAQLVAFLAFYPVATMETARGAAVGMRQFTNNQSDPIAEYKRLPQLLADLPPDEPVNLLLPDDAIKHRQIVAYFLRRPLISDWSNDDFIGWQLPPGGNVAMDPAHATLQYAPGRSDTSVAGMTLRRDIALAQGSVGKGWHGREQDATNNWWYWLEEHGDIDLTMTSEGWLTLQGDIAIIGAKERTVTIAIAELPSATRQYHLPERWFVPFTAERLHLAAGRYHVTISADGPATPMSATDARRVRMGVRNLLWTVTKD